MHPVDEATQAAYYTQALQLAFCQPNVRAILVFSLVDENALPGWQSGVYYVDGTPKSSLPAVATRRMRPPEPDLVPGPPGDAPAGRALVPERRPTSEPSTFPILLACDVDCVYRVRIERAATHGRPCR